MTARPRRAPRLTLVAVVAATLGADAPPPFEPASRVRRPEALAVVDGGAALLVANRRAGTVSEVDTAAGKVVAEHPAGAGLSDLKALAGGRLLLAVDHEGGALLLLERPGPGRLEIAARLDLGRGLVRVAPLPGGRSCAVSLREGRRVAFVAVGDSLRPLASLGLPFCPGELLAVDEGRAVVVADAYGGMVAVVSPDGPALLSARELPAHKLRGLTPAADGRSVLVAHQALSRLAVASFDDVHWGGLVRNRIRALPLETLLNPTANLAKAPAVVELDAIGRGAGDPEAVALAPGGRPFVALAGVGELIGAPGPGLAHFRVPAGERPVALAASPDCRLIYAADAEGDAVAFIPLDGGPSRLVSLGPRPAPTAEERGARLFASARLSHQGWMSCHSCHVGGHTNGKAADTRADGSYGAPKLVPSLLGVADTGPWGWLGNIDRLEEFVKASVESTMQGASPDDGQIADLTAYLRSLAPPAPNR